ncbi:unnamed protein product [Caretta caretta]
MKIFILICKQAEELLRREKARLSYLLLPHWWWLGCFSHDFLHLDLAVLCLSQSNPTFLPYSEGLLPLFLPLQPV